MIKKSPDRVDNRSMRSVRTVVLSLTLALVSVLVVPAPLAAAEIDAPRASARVVNEAADYASGSFSDPWDFKAANDLPLVEGLSHVRFSNVRVQGGRWMGTAQPQAHLRLLQSWNSLPNGRDGETHPIDADRYTHVSIRMRMTGHERAAAELAWFDCGLIKASCKGAMGFWVDEGWHTYDLAIVRDPARGAVDWAGEIRGLVLTPTAKGGAIEIDWIRLYEPTGPGVRYRSWDTHPETELIWDRDKNPANNTSANPNWSSIGTVGSGRTRLNTDALPPGRYFIYTLSPNGRSAIRRLTVNARPRPVVIQPDAIGGASYDTAVRGDAWDFSTASDVGLTRNMTFRIDNGRLVGTNGGITPSDSGFRLPLDPETPIVGNRFHRLSVRVFYEGGFSLAGEPGGGMNARFVWRTVTGDVRVSEDIVVFPGWNTITLDLTGIPPSELVEGGAPTGWANQRIELIRFDPHEDSGTRRFFVDWIRLADDDRPTNGRYTLSFRDRAHESGSVARIYLDRDADAEGGRLIATAPVSRARNRLDWTVPADLAGTGRWFVRVEITDPRGARQSAVSTGTIRL